MAKIPINKFDQFVKDKMEMHKTPVDTDRLWTNIREDAGRRKIGMIPGVFLILAVVFFTGIQLLNKDIEGLDATHASFISKSMDGFELVPARSADPQKFSKPSAAALFSSSNSTHSSKSNKSEKFYTNHPETKNAEQEPAPFSTITNTNNKHTPNSAGFATELVQDNTESEQLTKSTISELIGPHDSASYGEIPSYSDVGDLLHANAAEIAMLKTNIAALHSNAHSIPEFEKPDWKPSIRLLKQSKGLQLRLHAGAGIVFRKMSLINPEASQWMQKRMNNEYLNESIRIGLDLRINLNRNVYVFAGLEDFRINERFDYLDITDRTYQDKGHVANVIYDAESRKEEIGSREVKETITKTGTFYNQFLMINIPLGLGVSKSVGRFAFGAEAAVLVNAYHKFDGKMADSRNELVAMKDMPFTVSQLQTVRLHAIVAYRLSSGFSISLTSGADLALKGIKLGDYMEQSYTVWQGNLGICYHW